MKYLNYFSTFEKLLWLFSILSISTSFILLGNRNWLTLIASLIGVTFLIFNAKGNPIGQFLTIVFSVLYGIISYSFSYFGEMITYLGMTAPMALLALISWIKNPFQGKHSQVKINRISKIEVIFMFALTAVVTLVFYCILSAFNTANIIPSTLSVTTSFIAVYLTFRRSSYFALAYAANDLVLIVLWAMASVEDISYASVLVCFIVFLINDLYGFLNWKLMENQQSSEE